MARQIHRPTLVRLLQQLASVQGRLGDQRVVVLFREPPRSMQRASDDAHRLELRPRVADRIFVDCESLGKEFVADLLEPRLIGDLAAHHKQTQRQLRAAWAVYPLVEVADTLMQEAVERRRLRLPVVVVVLARLQLTGQSQRCRHDRRGSVSNALVALRIRRTGCLKKLSNISMTALHCAGLH